MSEPAEPRQQRANNFLIGAAVLIAAVVFWDITKAILIFVVTLGILVAVHEWGHFIAAKAVGVTVYEFAIGMGPRVLTYMRRGGTDYTIRAAPIGGLVLPKGMQPDDPVTPDGLNGRRAAEKALVYLAGPLMNMLFALLVAMSIGCLFGWGDDSVALVGEVQRKKPAARMDVISVDGQPVTGHKRGLQVGDHILAVDDVRPTRGLSVYRLINSKVEQPVSILVERHGKEILLQGVTERTTIKRPYAVVKQVPAGSTLDVRPGDQLELIDDQDVLELTGPKPAAAAMDLLKSKTGEKVRLRLWRNDHPVQTEGPAVPLVLDDIEVDRAIGILGFLPVPGAGKPTGVIESAREGFLVVVRIIQRLFSLFSRPKVLSQNVSGPVGIFAQMKGVDRLPAFHYCGVLVSLSLSLAVFNLLPIPILDGGHMTVLTVEVLRRRRLEPDTLVKVQYAGLMIVLTLFVLIIGKDLIKHLL